MNLPNKKTGGIWLTVREAVGALVGSPFGCIALGAALLGTGGMLRESAQHDRAASERAAWAESGVQDLRDSLRDESAVRAVKVRKPADLRVNALSTAGPRRLGSVRRAPSP